MSSETKTTRSSSGAKRLQAHRKRLQEADLVRVEILLPKDVREAIMGIAEAEGLKYLETASALTQMGLVSYQNLEQATFPVQEQGFAASLNCVASAGAPSSELFTRSLSAHRASFSSANAFTAQTSPLRNFLKARKGE